MRNRIGQLPDAVLPGPFGQGLLRLGMSKGFQSAGICALGRPAHGTGLQPGSRRNVLPRSGFVVEQHRILSDGYT